MTYLDTSVSLAHLVAERDVPPAEPWARPLVSSRLLEYEAWVRVQAMGLARSLGDATGNLLAKVALPELAPPIRARALEPLPSPARTLDALHLASADLLRGRRQPVELASHDERVLKAAEEVGIPV